MYVKYLRYWLKLIIIIINIHITHNTKTNILKLLGFSLILVYKRTERQSSV